MSINTKQLRELVIQPTLEYLGLDSLAAQNLLLGTCAQESAMGTYIKQVNGCALGIYQMEPATHDDIWKNFIFFNFSLKEKVSELGTTQGKLIGNLNYATAMCRIHYMRINEPLPAADNIYGLAAYWKKYYNTEKGKGTEEQFITNYQKYVTG
jgi:hypothetical protein